ncbi:MAG: accessory factor UbiK family protein [Gammaproteobacteria bacterium]
MEPGLIDDLAKRLAAKLPEGLNHLNEDLQTNFKAVLQSGLGKLDLVTRREFDVQRQVLERTREKLDAMIDRLNELEGKS